MGPRTQSLLSQLLVMGVGLGGYHLLVHPTQPPGVGVEPSPAPAGGPSSGSALPPLAVAPNFVRFEAMERRVANMERALSNASALGGAPPAGAGSAGSDGAPVPKGSSLVWTEDQLTGLRSMLTEIEVRKRQESYAAAMRAALRAGAKDSALPPEAEDKAIALLVAFQRRIWELFPDGTAGSTREEREAAVAAGRRAREALEEEIKKVLPLEQATAVLSRVQTFLTGPPPDRLVPPSDVGSR